MEADNVARKELKEEGRVKRKGERGKGTYTGVAEVNDVRAVRQPICNVRRGLGHVARVPINEEIRRYQCILKQGGDV